MVANGWPRCHWPPPTPTPGSENREIALEKPTEEDMEIDDLKLSPSRQNPEKRWAYVVVRSDEITYMKVQYRTR